MRLPVVQRCFCNENLQTATKMFALFESVEQCANITWLSIMAHKLKERDEEHHGLNKNDILFGIVVTMIVICSIQFLITMLLSYGAWAAKLSYIRPWPVYSSIGIVSYFVFCIFGIVVLSDSRHIAHIFGLVFVTMAEVCFKIYMIVVVHSYYFQLLNFSNQSYAVFQID